MSRETELEVYRTYNSAQERYTYFMLAAAGAAIAFAVTKTQDAKLAWSQVPLAVSILCWGISFFCGCMNLRYVGSSLYGNLELLKVERGEHPQVGPYLQLMQAASEGIRSTLERNSDRARRYSIQQFYLLISGAVFYVSWHIFEMYLRTR